MFLTNENLDDSFSLKKLSIGKKKPEYEKNKTLIENRFFFFFF